MLEHRLADLVLCPAAQKRRPPESDPQTSTLRAHVLAQASADAQALQAIARASYPHLLQATGPGALRNLVLALSHESRPQGDAAPGRGRILTACAAVCLDLGSQQRYEACFEQTHADAQCLQPLGVHGGAGVPRPVGVLAAQALDAIHNQVPPFPFVPCAELSPKGDKAQNPVEAAQLLPHSGMHCLSDTHNHGTELAMKVVRQARLELSGGSTPDLLRPFVP